MSIFDDVFKKYMSFLTEESKVKNAPEIKKKLPKNIQNKYEYKIKHDIDLIKESYSKKLNTIKNIDNLKQLLEDEKSKNVDIKFGYIKKYLNKSECYETLRQERWCENVHCPKCKSKKVAQISNENTNKDSENYRYKCHDCGYEFNDDSDTPLEHHPPTLQTWMQCWYLMGCTESIHIIAEKLNLNEQIVKEMISVLQKVFGTQKPRNTNKKDKETYKEYKFYEKQLKQAFTSKQDLLLGKEAISNPLDTAEDRKLRDRRDPNKPKGKF